MIRRFHPAHGWLLRTKWICRVQRRISGRYGRDFPKSRSFPPQPQKERGSLVKGHFGSDNDERQRCRVRGNLRWTRQQSVTKLGAVVWENELSQAIAPAFLSRRCCT